LERSSVGLRAMAGRGLGLFELICAVVGSFVLEGPSIEFVGVILGGLGYYFGLTSQDRVGQILRIAAAVLSVVSMGISGFEALLSS
jgi:hypothetical protein